MYVYILGHLIDNGRPTQRKSCNRKEVKITAENNEHINNSKRTLSLSSNTSSLVAKSTSVSSSQQGSSYNWPQAKTTKTPTDGDSDFDENINRDNGGKNLSLCDSTYIVNYMNLYRELLECI